jgi:hypothetical protein
MRAHLAVLAAGILAALPVFGAVTIETNAVVATVTPFAETAWMSVAGGNDWQPWYVTDTDGDGVVLLEYPGGIPSQGLWLGTDLSSGETMSARTYFGSAIPANEQPFPAKVFLRDGSGEYSQLSVSGNGRAFLLVRPGTGVWYFQGQDNTATDRDGGQNFLLTAGLADFAPLGPAAPVPSGVESGDRFLSIDHYSSWIADTVDAHLSESAGPGVLSFSQQYTSFISLYENAGPAQLMILRTEGTDGAVSIDYTTADETAHAGTDYDQTSGTLAFAAGERLKTLEIPIVNNTVGTGTRTFRVELSNPTGATLSGQTALQVIIFEDGDPPSLPTIHIQDVPTIEDTDARFSVTLSAPTTDQVSFVVTTVADSATPGLDYVETTQTVTIPVGETGTTLVIPILNDTLDEPGEIFYLTLSNPINAVLSIPSVYCVILDDDDVPPELSITHVSVPENAGSAVFTLTLSAQSATPIEVGYQTVAGTATSPNDFTHVLNSITFAPGEVSKTIAIPLVNDRAAERDETFTLQVSIEGSSEPTTATCTILNDDGGRGRAVRH